MGVMVISKRVIGGDREKEALTLLSDLKRLAKDEPGFNSEELWRHLEKTDEYLLVRSWDSEEDWRNWLSNPKRVAIEEKIESLLGRKTEYSAYEILRRTER
jgi:heme-degrading monooxygenase HmoA